jgi:hypothetical protein
MSPQERGSRRSIPGYLGRSTLRGDEAGGELRQVIIRVILAFAVSEEPTFEVCP